MSEPWGPLCTPAPAGAGPADLRSELAQGPGRWLPPPVALPPLLCPLGEPVGQGSEAAARLRVLQECHTLREHQGAGGTGMAAGDRGAQSYTSLEPQARYRPKGALWPPWQRAGRGRPWPEPRGSAPPSLGLFSVREEVATDHWCHMLKARIQQTGLCPLCDLHRVSGCEVPLPILRQYLRQSDCF